MTQLSVYWGGLGWMWGFVGGGVTSRGRSFIYNLPREIKLEICRLLDLCHVSCGKFIFFLMETT